MSRGWLDAVLMAALLPPAVSQSQQPPLPDNLRQQYRAELLVLRDSVHAIAAAAAFTRDPSAAGPETVLSRAQVLADRCRAAQRSLRAGEGVLAGSEPYVGRATSSFLQAAQRLRSVLRDECERVFAPAGGANADSVRAWGGYRTARIDRAVGEYEAAALRFGGALGIKLEPRTGR